MEMNFSYFLLVQIDDILPIECTDVMVEIRDVDEIQAKVLREIHRELLRVAERERNAV